MRIIDPYHLPAAAKRSYVITCVSAIVLFLSLLWLVISAPVISRWDSQLSNLAQAFRSAAADPIMLAVTLSGDVFVALSVALAILVYLLLHRQWWLSIHLVAVCLSAVWAVMIIKSVTARSRPVMLSSGLDSFSFPSGHACTAAVMTGIAALFIAHGRHPRTRKILFAIAAVITILIGLSRVYLQVHWPSDVVAGWLLGFALVVAFAWQLHQSDLQHERWLTPLILSVSALALVTHLAFNWSSKVATYNLIPVS